MGSFGKRLKRTQKSESESESEMGSEEEQNGFMNEVSSEEDFGGSDQYEDEGEDGVSAEEEGEEEASDDDDEEGEDDGDEQVDEDGEQEEDDADEEEEEEEDDDVGNRKGNRKGDEMEELEKEYRDIQNREQTLIQDLKRNKDEDLLKGQAIKSQKALWDKALEIRFLLQKSFSKSNKLPQEPVRSLFCESDEEVSTAFSNLIESSKKTIDSLLQLQEALVENNTSIAEAAEEGESQSSPRPSGGFDKMDGDHEKTWSQIAQMHSRVAAFRNKAVDRWQRKADVHSGAAAKKAKLLAFNQNISDQVATYMRDPSKMIRSMQMTREAIGVFGYVAPQAANTKEEGNAEGDPELLDDSEFYQQLLKEFFETIDPNASESAFYALKRLQTKKRKAVDRRASKSRKIRYHVHEKIVNFMAPQPMNLPPMAPKLFENLFGLKSQKSQKSSSAA